MADDVSEAGRVYPRAVAPIGGFDSKPGVAYVMQGREVGQYLIHGDGRGCIFHQHLGVIAGFRLNYYST